MELKNTSCCGLKEYEGLFSDPKDSLDAICEYRYNKRGFNSAFILFTDTIVNGRGELLKLLILNLKLGTITETDAVENPNTSKLLKVYVFAPNDVELKKWFTNRAEEFNKLHGDFKVGDTVEALPNDVYSTTRNGWRGVILSLGTTRMVVSGSGVNNPTVEKKYFKQLQKQLHEKI